MKQFFLASLWFLLSPGIAFLFSRPAFAGENDLPKVEPLNIKNETLTVPGTKVQIQLIAIPGGTFMMGSPNGEKGREANEGPAHLVAVRPFWMGKTEITWEQYDPFWKPLVPGWAPDEKLRLKALQELGIDALSGPSEGYYDITFGYGRGGRPALSMTHLAAMTYCRWLSQKTGKTFRLPTEAEWEWACRAGSTSAFCFGQDPKMLDDYAWHAGNSNDEPHPVGQKKPNAFGLYDMHGNVLEWCLDQYAAGFYATLPVNKPSLGPINIPGAIRYPHVTRGGSWPDKPAQLRSAARRPSDRWWNRSDPRIRKGWWWLTDADFLGFRIVRPLEENDALKGYRAKMPVDNR